MTSLGLLQYSDINESSPIGGNITGIEKKRQAIILLLKNVKLHRIALQLKTRRTIQRMYKTC